MGELGNCMGAIIEGDKRRCPRQMRRVAGFGFLVSGTARIFYPQMDADFLGDRDFQIAIGIAIESKSKSPVASRGSRVNSYCDHTVGAMMSVKALLCCFTRRLEGECPHEPPSAVRKDGRDERRSSAGKQTLVPPGASQARWQELEGGIGVAHKDGKLCGLRGLCVRFNWPALPLTSYPLPIT